MSGPGAFLAELRRRSVLRATVFYVIAAWIVLQITDLALPGLGVHEGAFR